MASNSSSEYKVIADKIVSPNEDIIIQIAGDIYKGSIEEPNRYVTTSDLEGVTGGSALNYVQVESDQVNVTTSPQELVSLTITTTGAPVQVAITGEGSNAVAGTWVKVALHRDGALIGQTIQIESSAISENVPYALNFIDDVAAGTYVYSAKIIGKSSGNWQFGEVSGPVMNAVELTGFKGDAGNAADLGNFEFSESTMSTDYPMNITVNGVPGDITLSAYNGVALAFADAEGAGLRFPDDTIQTTAYTGTANTNLVVPTAIKDQNDADFITFERTGTGTARIATPQDDLSLRSARDITLFAGDDGPGNVYIGWGDATMTPDANNRVATIGDIRSVSGDILPAADNEYTLGNSGYRWKSISIGEGTIYITDASTGSEVGLTIDNGVFFLDGIAQAQLPALITNNLELHDGNDNVVLRLVEDSGTGKLFFGGGTNGMWQDSGKTYITGISYHAEDSGRKPMFYNSSTGEVSYNSDALPTPGIYPRLNSTDTGVYGETTVGLLDHVGRLMYASLTATPSYYVIPTNEDVAFPIGAEIKFATSDESPWIINVAESPTITLIGEGSNGYTGINYNFIVPVNSTATLLKVDTDRWILSGLRLTD